MNGAKEVAWAIEFVENGKRTITVDYSKHLTPQEAKDAFAKQRGGLWEEFEKKGAKVVQREIVEFPRGSSPDPPQ
jgi:hypothetical protein